MLEQLATAHDSITQSGGSVVGLAPASSDQALRLMEESIPFRLFIDRSHAVRQRLEVEQQTLAHFLFSLAGWWRYFRAFLAGHWQRRITGHYGNVPAVCVVDATGEVRYVYRGRGLGDYPPLTTVLEALSRAAD